MSGVQNKDKSLSEFTLRPVGVVHSTLKSIDDCPLQGDEGAPDAWIEINDQFLEATNNLAAGDELILISWLHKANRRILKCVPRRQFDSPEIGVFSTRSPDRPNPVELHLVRILEVTSNKLKVSPLELLDGTPIIDIKPALKSEEERIAGG